MLLVSENWNTASDRRRFKAPKGTMYKLESFVFSNLSSTGAEFVVIDRGVEDDFSSDFQLSSQFLLHIDTGLDGHTFSGNIPHVCKFLTLGPRRSSTAIRCAISIYGELIKANKFDLIIEWFRKGR